MDRLNETVLKRTGDQIIRGRLQVKTIWANNVLAKVAKFNGHDISDYVHLPVASPKISTNVTITGKITVKKSLTVKSLITTTQVSGYKLHEMIDDTLVEGSDKVRVTGAKEFINLLTVENLVINGTLFGQSWDRIRGMSTTSGDKILFNGTTIFRNHLKTKRLVFRGELNGISRDDFGQSWLLYETDQFFTAPQTIENLKSKNSLKIGGNLNDLNVTYYFENCLWLKQPEYIRHVVFREKISSRSDIKVGGLIGKIRLEDCLFTRADYLQEISGTLVVEGYLNVTKHIFVEGSVNGLKMQNLKSFQQPSNDDELSEGLVIIGDCKLAVEPKIETLNYRNLNELYQNAWLLNEDVVLQQPVHFEDAQFGGKIHFKGLLNGIDMNVLAEKYFSLTQQQTISTIIRVKGDIVTNSYFVTETILLGGRITDSTG